MKKDAAGRRTKKAARRMDSEKFKRKTFYQKFFS